MPLDNTSRVEIQNSSIDVDLDDVLLSVVNSEEVHPQSRNFSGNL